MVLVHQAAPWRAPPAASSRLPQTAGRDKGRTGGGGGASSGPPAGTPARRTSRFPEGGAAGLRARVRRERLSPGVRESEPSRPTCATTHPCREAGGLSAPGRLWGPSSGKAPSVVPLARSGSAVTHSQIIAPDSGLQGTRPVTAKKPCQPGGFGSHPCDLHAAHLQNGCAGVDPVVLTSTFSRPFPCSCSCRRAAPCCL